MSGVWSDLDDKDAAAADGEARAENPEVDRSQLGKRLAVQNLDWDSIGVVDLFALFSSFCQANPATMDIDRVQIYPSLYGMEQMKNDLLYGPPKEMFKESKKKNKRRKKTAEDREFESDDEYRLNEHADGENMAQLRKYEVNKMKYFYGVVHCNSKKTAAKIYEEYNGFELELTNLRLTLAFIPDDLEFP